MRRKITYRILGILLFVAGHTYEVHAEIPSLPLIRRALAWAASTTKSGLKEIGKQLIIQGILTGIEMAYASARTAAYGRATESGALQKNYPALCSPNEGLIASETIPGEIQTSIIDMINHPEALERVGAHLWKGILLTGVPGTGKTQLGYLIARATGSRVVYEGATGLIDAAQGSGSRSIRNLFVRAQHKSIGQRALGLVKKILTMLHIRRAQPQKPTIVILDEIDSIGLPRGGAVAGLDQARAAERERTLEQLLTELDGAHQLKSIPDVFFVATSNRPAQELDPALVRPGRLKVINVPDLTEANRVAIMRYHQSRYLCQWAQDIDFTQFIKQHAPKTSGDYLAHTINDAVAAASRRALKQRAVTQADIVNAYNAYVLNARQSQQPVASTTPLAQASWFLQQIQQGAPTPVQQ